VDAALPRRWSPAISRPALEVRILSGQLTDASGAAPPSVTALPPSTVVEPPSASARPTEEVRRAALSESAPVQTAAALPLPPIDHDFDESEFLPYSKLTFRPAPLTDTTIPFPEGVNAHGISHPILTIFIDEEGNVVKVKVMDSDLTPPFETSALLTFRLARFRPGRIDDKAVKSRMRIEVTFDSEMYSRRDPLGLSRP